MDEHALVAVPLQGLPGAQVADPQEQDPQLDYERFRDLPAEQEQEEADLNGAGSQELAGVKLLREGAGPQAAALQRERRSHRNILLFRCRLAPGRYSDSSEGGWGWAASQPGAWSCHALHSGPQQHAAHRKRHGHHAACRGFRSGRGRRASASAATSSAPSGLQCSRV